MTTHMKYKFKEVILERGNSKTINTEDHLSQKSNISNRKKKSRSISSQ